MVRQNTLFAVCGLALGVGGCMEPVDYGSDEKALTTQGEDLEFPNFPLHYRGVGVFRDLADPQNTLIGDYTFNMELGVNTEYVSYIDRDIIAMQVYDLDPSDGTDPDREYFIELDHRGKPESCSLAPFPIPNVFYRDWWLHNDMVYDGQEVVNGYVADCWSGAIPEFGGAPARFCNRADAYPNFAPLLKQVATFVFYDYNGKELAHHDTPKSHFKLPRVCRGL